MQLNQDQLCAIVGSKELELIALRMEVAELKKQLEEATQDTKVKG